MLEDFKENSFYKYASNLTKFYHAYIFEVDDIDENYPLILAFAKMIICKNHYKDSHNCEGIRLFHPPIIVINCHLYKTI